ncbi:pantoate--beta-alanine ligase [Frankia sp. R82]|uniref:pantoate--beta-alanine ligase n=1 Tax=Frankia sp. R82 TaxID=2950553 RepID=UPI00204424BB|nr:pantoate--beta-alanine ligase [Frankia sp. R82]MCM3884500.1 pantoate--beta-alanine ligase [Frankia sp. R82]
MSIVLPAAPDQDCDQGFRRPIVARSRADLRVALDEAPSRDRPPTGERPPQPADSGTGTGTGSGRPTRAVVMTMGALHEGHASLLRAARAQADQVVATIYVNPLQFGAGEDLDRYPRTLEADLEICARAGVDVVFAPSTVHEVPPLVRLSAGPLGEVLEGASRPGHFDGMLTLVATMLHLVRPDLAYFGRKDAQQLVCIQRMVADLAFGVTVIGVDTVREPDGLARSSRNVYLTPSQRRSALALSAALRAGHAAALAGGGPQAVLAAAHAVLDPADGVEIDYLTLANPNDLGPVHSGPALLLVAARVGTTRLIDNISLVLPADRQGA